MVVSEAVLDSLKQIGLNLYERKLYVALLARGTSSAGELSEISSVPRSRAYDVLESLADKGFVIVQNAKPLKYVAVGPEEALDRHHKKLNDQVQVITERIANFKKSASIKELKSLYAKGVDLVEPGEFTGSLQGRDALHQQIGALIKNASKRVSLVLTPATFNELVDRHMDALEGAKKKGVKIKIGTHKGKDTEENIKKVSSIAEVKDVSDHTTGRLALADGEQFIVGLTHDVDTHPTQDLAIWSKSKHGAAVLEPMFDSLWKNAKSM